MAVISPDCEGRGVGPLAPCLLARSALGSPQPASACLLDPEVPASPPHTTDTPPPPLHPERPCFPVVNPPSLAHTAHSLCG